MQALPTVHRRRSGRHVTKLFRQGHNHYMAFKILCCFQEWCQCPTAVYVIHIFECHSPAVFQVLIPNGVASGGPLRGPIFVRDEEAINAKWTLAVISAVVRAEHQMRTAKGKGTRLVKVAAEGTGPRPSVSRGFIKRFHQIRFRITTSACCHADYRSRRTSLAFLSSLNDEPAAQPMRKKRRRTTHVGRMDNAAIAPAYCHGHSLFHQASLRDGTGCAALGCCVGIARSADSSTPLK